jgi:hypothetical protein
MIGRRLTALRLDKALVPYALRSLGRVAGVLDECGPTFVRGWIYDASRPNDTLTLDVVVDGRRVQQIAVDRDRPDIRALAKSHGRHGFEAEIACFAQPNVQRRSVELHLAGRPKYRLGPVELPANRDLSDFVTIDMRALNDRLSHIFNHVTAAHEHALRRFDELQVLMSRQVSVGTTLAGCQTHVSSYRQEAGIPDGPSGISGVGQFQAPRSEEAEVALFAARIHTEMMFAERA